MNMNIACKSSTLQNTLSLHSKSPGVGIARLSLPLLQLLILAHNPPPNNHAADDRQPTARNDDTAAHLVPRRLVRQEEIRREPVRDATSAVGDGDQGSPLCARPWHDGRLPRDVQVEGDEGPAAEEEEAEVAGPSLEGRDHDDGTDEGYDHGADDVPAVLEELAAGPGEDDADYVGEDVGRCLEEVGVGLGEVEGIEDLVFRLVRTLLYDLCKRHLTEGKKSLKDWATITAK